MQASRAQRGAPRRHGGVEGSVTEGVGVCDDIARV
jgi:hypothetical protein